MRKLKQKLAAVLAFVLIAAMLAPFGAFAPLAASARPIFEVEQREVNGMIFVPLRATAYAHGWEVHWQRPVITLVNPTGFAEEFVLNELVAMLGGFIERGTTWIPIEVAQSIFESIQLLFTLNEEAKEIALYDFDYMVRFVMENTVWDSVMRRAWGIGFTDIAAGARQWIELMEPLPITVFDPEMYDTFRSQVPLHEGGTVEEMAANYLFMLLAMVMAPQLGGVGHLGPRTLDMYIAQVTEFERQMHQITYATGLVQYTMQLMLEMAFHHPRAIWFYGEVDVDLYEEESAFPQVPGNVTTAIITDEIAYMHIASWLTDADYDDEIILPFLQEVADFEHLIIDVRGNLGGLMNYPIQRIFARLINEPVEFSTHEFFAGGDAAVAMMNATMATALAAIALADELLEELPYYYAYELGLAEGVTIGETVYVEILCAQEFIYEQGMVDFYPGDAALLDYVMVTRSLVTPADSVGFEGQIWLLVDGWSTSATAFLANIMSVTGIATIVGENTSFVMGSSHVYTALPNTGIIWRADIGYRTDAYGNSWDAFGIAPDIRNFDGMDALDTVLTIIMGQDELASW
jgi:hypothetical protein